MNMNTRNEVLGSLLIPRTRGRSPLLQGKKIASTVELVHLVTGTGRSRRLESDNVPVEAQV